MKRIFFLTVFFWAASFSFAGEPTPYPFKSFSIEITLWPPYGKTVLSVECSSAKYGFARRLTAFKLKTEKGVFAAPSEMLSKFRNPEGIQVMNNVDGNKVSIVFDYESEPDHIYTQGGEISFDDQARFKVERAAGQSKP